MLSVGEDIGILVCSFVTMIAEWCTHLIVAGGGVEWSLLPIIDDEDDDWVLVGGC